MWIRKVQKRTFRLGYLLVGTLSMIAISVFVESNAEIPHVLDDAKMQEIVGRTSNKYECQNESNGCYPEDGSGHCYGYYKNYSQSSFKHCVHTGDNNDNCTDNSGSEIKICTTYWYTESGCHWTKFDFSGDENYVQCAY